MKIITFGVIPIAIRYGDHSFAYWKWYQFDIQASRSVNSDHEGVVFTKLKYRFIVFFGIFSSVFGIFRYLEYRLWYRYFEIPRYSVSVIPTQAMLSLPKP